MFQLAPPNLICPQGSGPMSAAIWHNLTVSVALPDEGAGLPADLRIGLDREMHHFSCEDPPCRRPSFCCWMRRCHQYTPPAGRSPIYHSDAFEAFACDQKDRRYRREAQLGDGKC